MNWYNQRGKLLPKIKKLDNAKKLDISLLRKILIRQSPSKTQHQLTFRKWLQKWIETNIQNVFTELDAVGNLYVVKGKNNIYPCIVAHLDTAQNIHSGLNIMELGNIIFGFNLHTGEQCGIGADDKCGIYIALECLKKFDNLKCFFPIDEEIGCIGSGQCNFEFFKDCSFLGQPDRRSYTTDFINFTNGIEVCNKDFYGLIESQMEWYGYKLNTGSCTDIGTIKKNPNVNIPAFNFSCGYIDEHTDTEIIFKSGLENAMNFLFSVIEKVGYVKHIHAVPITKQREFRGFQELEEEDVEFINEPIVYKCDHYKFTSYDDELYMEDMISVGQCPYCNSSIKEYIENNEFYYYCNECDSKWDIIPIDEMIGV